MENKEIIKHDCKLVFNAGIARHLLKMGCTICDLKPSKENPKDKTVFVFVKDEKFNEAMSEINGQIKAAKNTAVE